MGCDYYIAQYIVLFDDQNVEIGRFTFDRSNGYYDSYNIMSKQSFDEYRRKCLTNADPKIIFSGGCFADKFFEYECRHFCEKYKNVNSIEIHESRWERN